MSPQEFFEELAALKLPWQVEHHDLGKPDEALDALRYTDEHGFCFCPITAVCAKKTGVHYEIDHFLKASNRLQLKDYFYIVHASDRNLGEYRRELLIATNLLPVEPVKETV